MKIDPKQIAKMITEDPDEVNPLDNIEDEFVRKDYIIWCDYCEEEYTEEDEEWYGPLTKCENCGASWCGSCLPEGDTWRQRVGKTGHRHTISDNLLLTCPLCPHDSNDAPIIQDV